MRRGTCLRCAAWGLVAWTALSGAASAAPPWQKLALFKRIDADPEKSYPLTEEQGPWLILVTTFIGEGAEERAARLCYELRKDYKLQAYTHRVHFDFAKDDSQGRAMAARRVKYRSMQSEEVAVLVGDFQSVDDDKAQRTLKIVKNQCEPACLKTQEETPEQKNLVTRFRGVWRTVGTQGAARGEYSERMDRKKTGLLSAAHLTANPLLPDEYYAPKGMDKFVVEMNKPVEHSLLKCRAKYTVKVATFSGRVIIDQKKIQQVGEGKEVTSKLAEAADKAHRLTEALRAQGYEAYEFHDRGQSIVTVGSFDTCGSPRADEKIEINPAIHTVMTTFGADKTVVPGQPPRVGMPKVIAGIPLDVQPMIVEVPRRSIGSEYAAEAGAWKRR